MKILLIGHEGYLGRGLLSFLRCQGHNIIGWDQKDDLFTLNANFLARENIELLINLSVMADRGSKTFHVDTPTDHVNVGGARHLANILQGSDVAWIQMSTREVLGPVYGPDDVTHTPNGMRPKFLVDETWPYSPQNFYGKSKIMAEFISESHPYSSIIRLTTCYTDYDHPTNANWVVALIKSVVQGEAVHLTQAGEQFRDPLHIDDLGRLMELIVEKKVFGERIHASGGSQNMISLRELVRLASQDVQIENEPGGDYGFAFDIRKATRLTGWQPAILIRERIPNMAENIRLGRYSAEL